jgi:parallel beta-helix repeat protein
MVNSSLVVTLYVNPATGNDTATGTRLAPLKTLKRALKLIKAPKTIIQLAPGYYNVASGESFPLVIPAGVMLLGNEATKGQGVVISGNGEYRSESFGVQNITILLLGDAQIMGISVSNNSTAKGTGVWVESGASTLANNTFMNCSREGIFISGTAKPAITDNLFIQNAAGGLVMSRNSKGEVLRNIFEKNTIGIAISDFAAPLVVSNQIKQNNIGIALSRETRPVLRNNLLEKNTQGGLLVNGKAIPDLGSSQDPAGNIFRDNQDYDVQNLTQEKLVAVGNRLNPASSVGLIDFIAATEDLQREVANNTMFPDLGGHWATTFVEALVSKGLISGFPDGTFKPDAPMTRAQYAAVIAKTFQLSEANNRNFTDVKSDFWAAPAIKRAATAGFISGFPDGSFRPAQNLTKIQAIVSIVNGLKLTDANPNVLSIYTDRAQIPSFATDAVAVATQKLLVLNYPQVEQLEPLRDITRAEVATLLYQALVNSGKEKAIVSPYIVNPDANISSYLDLLGHWAEPFIRALSSMNLTKGFEDGTYQPDKPMTRAQYAVLVASAFNPTPKKHPSPEFIDVKSDFWAYSSIQKAASAGFVGGFNDRTFRPQQNVQRLQVIVSLVNGLALPAAHNSAINCYSDRNTIPDYARTAVATATNQSIVVNYPDPKQIQPSRSATRGEVAAMVYQALVATKRTSAINSPYVVSLPITYQ